MPASADTLVMGVGRLFPKRTEMLVLSGCLFLNRAICDTVIPVFPAQHPSTCFPTWGPVLDLLYVMGSPQPPQCHCFFAVYAIS